MDTFDLQLLMYTAGSNLHEAQTTFARGNAVGAAFVLGRADECLVILNNSPLTLAFDPRRRRTTRMLEDVRDLFQKLKIQAER